MQKKDYQKLLKCPFCGGEAKYENIDGYYYTVCDECGARNFAFTKEQACDEWNSRVDVALTRSDIEKMVKLEWVKYRENDWCAFINFRRIYSARIKIIEEIIYSIYFEDLYLEDYKICSTSSLEEAQAFAKEWLVDLICSALGVEEEK